MSKSAKTSIFILMACLIASLGYGFYVLTQNQQLEEVKVGLEGQLEQANAREKKNIIKMRNLEEDIKETEQKLTEEENTSQSLRLQVSDIESQMKSLEDSLNRKISSLEREKGQWQERIDRISKERDDFMEKLRVAQRKQGDLERATQARTQPTSDFSQSRPDTSDADEEYWASILKQKAKLEVEVDRLKDKINEDSIELVDLRQKNEHLALKIDALESQKNEVDRQIRDKEELVNRLSLEVARAKNDRKYEELQVKNLKDENTNLRRQMRELVSSKNALEKSIIRLTQDKVKMEKKLGQSETIIQSKIDEIWEIKDSLDESFKQSKVETDTSNEVELPPIVVKTKGDAVNFMPGMTHAGFNGKVVSINDENNFVIVDIGETQGLRLGDALSVYRDSKYIARLKVIQVRKDIAAADINDQWSRVRIGDTVR